MRKTLRHLDFTNMQSPWGVAVHPLEGTRQVGRFIPKGFLNRHLNVAVHPNELAPQKQRDDQERADQTENPPQSDVDRQEIPNPSHHQHPCRSLHPVQKKGLHARQPGVLAGDEIRKDHGRRLNIAPDCDHRSEQQ